MQIEGWKYYNHAGVQATAPHLEVNTECVEDGRIWQLDGSPLLARWTTNFDCEKETNWWYVIKDTPFDISALKSKRRYEITRGDRFFEVRIIDATDYKEEIYSCQVQAFSAYPKKYRPTVIRDEFIKEIDTWKDFIVYGAFDRESGTLSGYSLLKKTDERHIVFSVQKTMPSAEKNGVNFALVHAILTSQDEFIRGGGYICDGERSINHETNFQDFLERYFGFRKAYCTLNVRYKKKIAFIVKCLYPFRKLLKKMDGVGLIHKINAIMKMEEIVRSGKQ